ncbi:hypothetical protein ACTXT7_008359 [Hymenolepis weldensis]
MSAANELRKGYDLLTQTLQANSQTWITSKLNEFAIDPSSLARHYAKLLEFRRASVETNIKMLRFSREASLTNYIEIICLEKLIRFIIIIMDVEAKKLPTSQV